MPHLKSNAVVTSRGRLSRRPIASNPLLLSLAKSVQSEARGRSDAGVVADHICAIWRIHFNGGLGTKARIVNCAVAGDNDFRHGDFDDLVIKLIADSSIAVSYPDCSGRHRRRLAA